MVELRIVGIIYDTGTKPRQQSAQSSHTCNLYLENKQQKNRELNNIKKLKNKLFLNSKAKIRPWVVISLLAAQPMISHERPYISSMFTSEMDLHFLVAL